MLARDSIRPFCAAAFAAACIPAAAGAETGGQGVPEDPQVRSVACLPTAGPCPAEGRLVRGGRLVVRGSDLEATETIVFTGARGRADDVAVKPETVASGRVEAAVPSKAKDGRLVLVSTFGGRSATPGTVRIAAPVARDVAPKNGYFYAARRKPSYTVNVQEPSSVRVELLRDDDDSVVAGWDVQATPGQPTTVRWDGGGATKPPASGNYRFRIAGAASAAAAPTADGPGTFAFFDHLFPIRGKHNLGYTATNDFGGSRGHKGQDLFAACGTPLAAARGGKVEFAGYHSAAGNYLVVDGDGTDVDYVYMHLRKPALVNTGARVFTGQQIGEVGETGRASGCHLHFEMWSGPGWYAGGKPFDPKPQLTAWDRYS